MTANWLNDHARKILAIAEASKDYATWARVARELRKGIELVAKLTGELDPRSVAAEDGKLQIVVEHVSVPLPDWNKPKQVIEATPVTPEPAEAGQNKSN